MFNRTLAFWANWLLVGAIIMFLDAVATFFMAEVYATEGYDLLFREGTYRELPREAIVWMRGLIGVIAGMAASSGVLLIGIALYPFRRGERWTWIVVACATLPWNAIATLYMLMIMDGEKIGLVLLGGAMYWVLFLPPVILSRKFFFVGVSA